RRWPAAWPIACSRSTHRPCTTSNRGGRQQVRPRRCQRHAGSPICRTLRADVGVRDGKIAQISDVIGSQEAHEVVDARGKVVFPGGVDAHFHLGMYRTLAQDAESETRSSLVGGVTSVISYFRTGAMYLNKTGPYRDILPEVLVGTAGHSYA